MGSTITRELWDTLRQVISSPISDESLKLMEEIRSQVQGHRLHELLVGYFEQTNAKGNEIINSPLVIAQTDEQRNALEQGRLLGKSYELDGIAEIEGAMYERHINFLKKIGDSRIVYRGDSKLNDGQYCGRWNFTTFTDGDLASEGKFVLVRTTQ
ncbi:MAG: hypothetical protein IIA87_01485 [Nanoarchaeota archaeon]|nr:hypothetical protein [Nanoarchaeota archaeon]